MVESLFAAALRALAGLKLCLPSCNFVFFVVQSFFSAASPTSPARQAS